MKLRNKKTGKVVEWFNNTDDIFPNTLAELNEEWEDYEEPKEYWIPMSDEPYPFVDNDWEKEGLATGLISLSKEENEIKREKLKAWQRLKDKGFRFGGWTHTPITKSLTGYNLHIKAYTDKLADYMDDLQLLFGGEE